ncbi:fumarylacetoacetate hydrolase family protein [Moritella sp. 36]|uniref:fumarylacetoacetate hydrolase family protein n=1 Tax=Moritella sp. 36 TaxID=2746233 RepID=UPI001BA8F8C1|nr:fumarylacetoacetate hydrolase family protein [Moritella sp. 36]QUM89277.1 fumarylacetoacetate hydrolase family protein [Moritella sp. 36]
MSYSLYQHQSISDNTLDLPTGKVVCIGRNYLDHIRELDNEVPEQALLFMKPATALVSLDEPLLLPAGLGECHNELEVALLINSPIQRGDDINITEMIWGVGLGLDLTLRDLQSKLKNKGQPWERAKAFDYSCPISRFIPINEFHDLNQLEFSLIINNITRQQGSTAKMMRSIESLLSEITDCFTLLPGDIVLTGTPAGVGVLNSGDKLALTLANRYKFGCEII